MADHDSANVKDLFLEALELDGEEREAMLARLAEENAEAARAVRGLLGAHEGADKLERTMAGPVMKAVLGPSPYKEGVRLGDYELLEEVGSGAFGEVWRARQLSLGRTVAVKVLRGGRWASPKELDRFRSEAAAVALLDHPGIVPVYEVAEHDGQPFFSMKWIDGGTLADVPKRPWPALRAVELVAKVARAVHHAHQRGVLHRDIKPSNVLLDEDARPHIADFGVAKRLDGAAEGATTGVLVGTPGYMAPEQIEGGELTVATDVWALGCILFELLTGRQPFEGATVTELLRKVRQDAPPPLRSLRPGVPRDLETIVEVCLRKEPDRRYASAYALALDLERWVAQEPISARRTSAFGRLRLFCRRSPLAASLIGLAIGLLVLLTAVSTWASIELGASLRESYLGQARATRLSGTVGARSAALDLLQRAAKVRVDQDLRDEAIACLALTDLLREHVVERPDGLEYYMLSPDPQFERLAFYRDDELHVVSMPEFTELFTLSDFEHAVQVLWSPSGRYLAARFGGAAPHVSIWDMTSREPVARVPGTSTFAGMSFAPDETRFALTTRGVQHELVVVTIAGEEVWRVRTGERIDALSFDPSGERIAVALDGDEHGDDPERGPPSFEVRSASNGEVRRKVALPDDAFDVRWAAGGRELAIASADLRILVFGEEGDEPRMTCVGHGAEVTRVFAPPGVPILASNSWDETARIWDAETGRELRRLSGHIIGFDASGRRLLVSDANAWSIWRIEQGEFFREVRAHTGKSPWTVTVAPDGRTVYSGGPDGILRWDGRSRAQTEPLLEIDTRAICIPPAGDALHTATLSGLWRIDPNGIEPPVELDAGADYLCLVQSSDGARLLALQRSRIVSVDPTGATPAEVVAEGSNLEYLSASADLSTFAAGNWRGHGVRVWNRNGPGEPLVVLPDEVNVCSAMSPDGRMLATASNERIKLWSVPSGELLLDVARASSFGNLAACIAFRGDGRMLAYASSNATVALLDVETLTPWGTLAAPGAELVGDIAFSPDGSKLAVACTANRVQLWDLDALERELVELGLVRER